MPVPDASCRRHVQLSSIQHHSQTVSINKYYILVLPYFFSIVRCAQLCSMRLSRDWNPIGRWTFSPSTNPHREAALMSVVPPLGWGHQRPSKSGFGW